MTQWNAVADALWVAANRAGVDPIGSGRILRPDGSEVMSVRGLELVVANGVLRIVDTKRVAWRAGVSG